MAPQAFGQDATAFEADVFQVAAVLAHLVLQPRHQATGRVDRHQKGARVIFACALAGHRTISTIVR